MKTFAMLILLAGVMLLCGCPDDDPLDCTSPCSIGTKMCETDDDKMGCCWPQTSSGMMCVCVEGECRGSTSGTTPGTTSGVGGMASAKTAPADSVSLPAPGQHADYQFVPPAVSSWIELTLLPDGRGSGAGQLIATTGSLLVRAQRRMPPEDHLIDLQVLQGGLQAGAVDVPCFGNTGPNSLQYEEFIGTFDLTTMAVHVEYTARLTNALFPPEDPAILEGTIRGSLDLQTGDTSLSSRHKLTLPATWDADGDRLPDFCSEPIQPLYVDGEAMGANDGSSWLDAFDDLQLAIQAAAGDSTLGYRARQIWVREGVYKPSLRVQPSDPRSATFALSPTTALYGGFAGGETSLEDRDVVAHPTVLSGDLLGDDEPGFLNRSDNCYHIVSVRETFDRTILDGFELRGGQADGSLPFLRRGGAVIIENGKLRVENCTFRGNYASVAGGAIATVNYGDPGLMGCRFVGNQSGDSGGGISLGAGSDATVVNCRFFGNSAAVRGGAVHAASSRYYLFNGLFDGNEAATSGGAVSNGPETAAVIIGTTFYSNTASGGTGGGIHHEGDGMELSNNILWGNTAQGLQDEPAQVFADELAGVAVNFSCVQGWSGGIPGEQNIGLPPQFADPLGADGVPGTPDDDLHLQASSPCIDAGSGSAMVIDRLDVDRDVVIGEGIPVDLDGHQRIVGAAVGMGAYEFQGVSGVVDDHETPVPGIAGLQVYPNPSNPQAKIRYALTAGGQVKVSVYNLRGEMVAVLVNEVKKAGPHEVTWDGRDANGRLVAAGAYLVTVSSGGRRAVEKLMIVK